MRGCADLTTGRRRGSSATTAGARTRCRERCPECGGSRIRQVGLGTERVEEEARAEFPGARTVRWDRDVTRGRDSHEAILARFLAHEADILIGTQMIAKGLDIPLVTLVGVVSADVALHLPDFRAGERTFQLLEQVAGRAGRGPKGGRVIIQTYTPDHYAIEAAAEHDYHAHVRARDRVPAADGLSAVRAAGADDVRAHGRRVRAAPGDDDGAPLRESRRTDGRAEPRRPGPGAGLRAADPRALALEHHPPRR